jgi:hypothetical protein
MDVYASFAKAAMASKLSADFLREMEKMANPICRYRSFNRDFRADLGLPAIYDNATPIQKAQWWIDLGEYVTGEPMGDIDPDSRVFHIHFSYLRRPRG